MFLVRVSRSIRPQDGNNPISRQQKMSLKLFSTDIVDGAATFVTTIVGRLRKVIKSTKDENWTWEQRSMSETGGVECFSSYGRTMS